MAEARQEAFCALQEVQDLFEKNIELGGVLKNNIPLLEETSEIFNQFFFKSYLQPDRAKDLYMDWYSQLIDNLPKDVQCITVGVLEDEYLSEEIFLFNALLKADSITKDSYITAIRTIINQSQQLG